MISAEWVYSWKVNELGHVVRAKATLVARGFAQREGIDFFETFSPCPSVASIRLLAAIACEFAWDLCHFDAEQAFVQSKLDERVFIRLPPGCGEISGKVVKLGRSLFGLRQSSRTWHNHLMRGLKCLGFESYAADACVMRLIEHNVVVMVVVVHVDDIFSIGLKSKCDKFGVDLNRYVPITNLGELRWYAGCRFSRDAVLGTVTMSQQAVAEKIVAKFGVTHNKETPMVVGLKLEQFNADEPDVEEPFRSLVGHLMWLANQTRPDFLNVVRAVARYSHSPKRLHWQAAMHVLMYVRFTSSLGISFQRGMVGGDRMELFVDSDFASKATDRRSVSGAVVMFSGACVMYLCRTQKSVALSSMEAEYVAMADGMKEAIFLRYLWSFIFPNRDVGCTLIHEDNVSAMHLACNPATTPNSKHIDIRHHFIRERVERGEFKIVHVRSDLQRADFLTKPLPKEIFCAHRDFVMNIR